MRVPYDLEFYHMMINLDLDIRPRHLFCKGENKKMLV